MASDLDHTIHVLMALPVHERLKVVEAVWDSIDADTSPVSLTDSARAELDRRIAAHEADPGTSLSWNQVLEQLRGQL